jgi:branched-chain amino acid transport system ATP-binding protein
MSVLDVRDVSRHFGTLAALQDISLRIEQGELRAVIGPNGAGKTTFFNLISGLFPPSSGRIVFEERDITDVPVARRVAMGIARTFQITEVFPELTVRENLQIAVEVAAGLRLHPWLPRAAERRLRARADELIDLGGLTALADRVVGELAHGDQRSTEIMMALALKPKLLLLDEPTAGMGDQETFHITRLVRRLHRERALTIVLIEHDMRVVFNLADRVTVLAAGRVLAEGTPADIAADEHVQTAYLGRAA